MPYLVGGADVKKSNVELKFECEHETSDVIKLFVPDSAEEWSLTSYFSIWDNLCRNWQLFVQSLDRYL